jgi:hypothetical protein
MAKRKTNLTHCAICKTEITERKSVITNHQPAVKDWIAYCELHAPRITYDSVSVRW